MPQVVPLAEIHRFVLEELRGIKNTVIVGAQAVNAYVGQPRMTSDVDVQSTRPFEVADQIKQAIHKRFHVAVRIGQTKHTTRIYQLATKTSPKRFLVDVEGVAELPPHEEKCGLRIAAPIELLAMKAIAAAGRSHRPEGMQDRADMMRLLARFPRLRDSKEVLHRMKQRGAPESAMGVWDEIAKASNKEGGGHAWSRSRRRFRKPSGTTRRSAAEALQRRYGHVRGGVRFLGIDDITTTCSNCGKKNLDSTVVLSVHGAKPARYGVECARRVLRGET